MLLFRENVLGGTKWNAGGPLGVATGEEAWELRLVMKSEDVRENRGVLANCISYQLVRIKTFSH